MRKFRTSFSGYNKDDVNEFVSEVIREYESILQKLRNSTKEMEQLKELINLKFINKIVTLSDTVWRYGFNPLRKFSISQLGLFQKGDETFEVHEFEEI